MLAEQLRVIKINFCQLIALVAVFRIYNQVGWHLHDYFIFANVLSCHGTEVAILALAKHNRVLYLRVLNPVLLAEGEKLCKPVSGGLFSSLEPVFVDFVFGNRS